MAPPPATWALCAYLAFALIQLWILLIPHVFVFILGIFAFNWYCICSCVCLCDRKWGYLISKQQMCLFRAVLLNSGRMLLFYLSQNWQSCTQKLFKKPIWGCFRCPVQIFVHLLTCDVMMDVQLSFKNVQIVSPCRSTASAELGLHLNSP